jgi:hypothetical protein
MTLGKRDIERKMSATTKVLLIVYVHILVRFIQDLLLIKIQRK